MNVRGRIVVGLMVAGLLLAACGGSSKPSYCSAVGNLKDSIKALPSTDVIANGTNALKSAFSKVQDNANAAVNAAKSDFPNETTAVKSAVDALSSTVQQVSSSPSAATIAQLPGQVSALVTAVQNLTKAASSKC
jgi:phage-related protein